MQCISIKQAIQTEKDKVFVMSKMIPVFEPVIGQDEIEAVVAALRKGEISGRLRHNSSI